jgi:HK97 family phage prohead protease
MGKERRYTIKAELRAEPDENGDGPPKIRGYAVVYGQLSEDLGGFREKISHGAFSEALGADIRALWQHDRSQVLGRTAAGTLRLWEDNNGVWFELDPPDTQAGRDAVELIRRGDVDQMSFGFTVDEQEWNTESVPPLRSVTSAKLIEVSPVTWPAYRGTSAEARDIYGDLPKIPDIAGAGDTGQDSTNDDEQARARMANRRRQLDIKQLEQE